MDREFHLNKRQIKKLELGGYTYRHLYIRIPEDPTKKALIVDGSGNIVKQITMAEAFRL